MANGPVAQPGGAPVLYGSVSFNGSHRSEPVVLSSKKLAGIYNRNMASVESLSGAILIILNVLPVDFILAGA